MVKPKIYYDKGLTEKARFLRKNNPRTPLQEGNDSEIVNSAKFPSNKEG